MPAEDEEREREQSDSAHTPHGQLFTLRALCTNVTAVDPSQLLSYTLDVAALTSPNRKHVGQARLEKMRRARGHREATKSSRARSRAVTSMLRNARQGRRVADWSMSRDDRVRPSAIKSIR
jgi:hypothetical protein